MNKTLSIVVLLLFVTSGFTGCRTFKGAKEDVQHTPQDVADGATAVGHSVVRTDAWIRQNMW